MSKLQFPKVDIKGFMRMHEGTMSDSELNWEVKGYISSSIKIVEEIASKQLDKALAGGIINNNEWFKAHSLFNDTWFQLNRIVSEMWVNNELLLDNAEEIFLSKIQSPLDNLESIEGDLLDSILQ